MPRLTAVLALLTLTSVGCVQDEPEYIVSLQSPSLTKLHEGGYLSATFLATDDEGEALPCGTGLLEVKARLQHPDGSWTTLDASDIEMSCDDGKGGDLAVVVDNSGSEDGYLSELQTGATNVLRNVKRRGGNASLVRVSTNSAVEVPLTSDGTALDAGIEELYIADGWTALYDGVRMGNETLADRRDLPPPSKCGENRLLGMVVFTDGQDNNSADEKDGVIDSGKYPGDGIDTTFEDLRDLEIDGKSTPIYTIGLGDEIAEDELKDLAESSGGRYLHVDTADDLVKVFDIVGDYFDAEHQVCATIDDLVCGKYTLEVEWSFSYGETGASGKATEIIDVPCEDEPDSRIVTALLTFSDPGISKTTASKLANNALKWAAPGAKSVLVVLDDNHKGEDKGDAAYISKLLTGYKVTLKDEPKAGLTAKDLEGYDAVWFSNPGYPPDDKATVDSLRTFSAEGGGVVLSGDDMSWSWGKKVSMSPLTHLNHKDNGVRACGIYIDNNKGSTYTVTFDKKSVHPVSSGLAGSSFKYGNDIDNSVGAGDGEVVLATATPTDDKTCAARPVVVAFEPAEDKKRETGKK